MKTATEIADPEAAQTQTLKRAGNSASDTFCTTLNTSLAEHK